MYYTDAPAASDQSTMVSTILGSPTHKLCFYIFLVSPWQHDEKLLVAL